MRFQFVSEMGQGLGLAVHAASEGHAVAFHVAADVFKAIGTGVVPQGHNVNSADIIIYDSGSFTEYADTLRQRGKRVIGPSLWTQTLAQDADYTHAIARSLGWEIDNSVTGDEFCITAWFNGTRFISVYVGIVYQYLFHRNHGPMTDCAGMLADFWIDRGSKTYSEILDPLTRLMRKVSHRGLVTIHLRATKDRYTVRSISADMAHPLSTLLYENSRLSVSDLLVKVFDEGSQPITPLERWSGGLLVTLPPYPYKHADATPLPGLSSGSLKHMWIEDIALHDGKWMSAGTHGRLGYITARGGDLNEVKKRMYRTVRNIGVESLQYRDDIGKEAYRVFTSLAESGWTRRLV